MHHPTLYRQLDNHVQYNHAPYNQTPHHHHPLNHLTRYHQLNNWTQYNHMLSSHHHLANHPTLNALMQYNMMLLHQRPPTMVEAKYMFEGVFYGMFSFICLCAVK